MKCIICENIIDNNKSYRLKENMFGYEDYFDYFMCSSCHCLQINAPPGNIQKYYSSDYYSQIKLLNNPGKIKKFLYKIRSSASQTGLYFIANLINKRRILTLIRYGKIKFNHKILDVGCGNGSLLYDFQHYGFNNLTGIDPYLNKEFLNSRLKLYRKELFKLKGKYDVVIFNHSFEHIWEQNETLAKTRELLSENGLIIIRQPVLNFAFDKYGENWVQLDAPRHFIIHSGRSMNVLCGKHNLKVKKVIFDSTELQFLGSEQVKKGIPQTADNSYLVNPDKSIFTKEDIKKYRKSSGKLNKEGRGDQAAFFIRKR